jgi:hypothetical protein
MEKALTITLERRAILSIEAKNGGCAKASVLGIPQTCVSHVTHARQTREE